VNEDDSLGSGGQDAFRSLGVTFWLSGSTSAKAASRLN
jgi:hypothetical protein